MTVNVADLELEKPDTLGFNVLCIYARKPPEFAVYRTSQRVLVHFADDRKLSDEQRKSLAQFAPIRGEINGLIDGWRDSPDTRLLLGFIPIARGLTLRKKAERYDRSVGDALHVALEGDLTGAGVLLNEVKQDILDERVGWARFEYLLCAFFIAVAVTVLAMIGANSAADTCGGASRRFLCLEEGHDLWHGALAGAWGAFFSIALAIRGRTVLADLHRISNLMDSLLRVVVGVIGGLVFVALILGDFVRLYVGASSPSQYDLIHILIAGFIAGFAERMVPDLLAKGEGRTGESPVIRRPEPEAAAAPGPAKRAAAQDPGGDADAADGEPAADPLPHQAGEDGCVADIDLDDDEVTPDECLPAASGGVAQESEVRP